uniref:C2 domain-containing protein n=1 Tax=Glycine max TaxID=3847 RepID=C6TH37_SOYBN|nr:unknown [Glycine max]
MGSRYEAEVKPLSARALKNVNWRHGPNLPYVVVWADRSYLLSTSVDENGNTDANWNETLTIPLPAKPLEDQNLFIHVVHAGSGEDTKSLIGKAWLRLVDIVNDFGIGERVRCTLSLKRPSGRPQGKAEVSVTIRESSYGAQGGYNAPPNGAPPQKANCYATPSGYPYNATAKGWATLAAVFGGISVEDAEYVDDKNQDDAEEKRVEDDLGAEDKIQDNVEARVGDDLGDPAADDDDFWR